MINFSTIVSNMQNFYRLDYEGFSLILFGIYIILDYKKYGREAMMFQVKYFGMDVEKANSNIKSMQLGYLFLSIFFILIGLTLLPRTGQLHTGTPPTGVFAQFVNIFLISWHLFLIYKIIQSIRSKFN